MPVSLLTPAPPALIPRCVDIEIYTDGAAEPNPGRGGYAARVLSQGQVIGEIVGFAVHTTNNRMEMLAAIMALDRVPVAAKQRVCIVTDSQYLERGATAWMAKWKKLGWVRKRKGKAQPVLNLDLWQRLDLAMQRIRDHGGDVTWRWERGHIGEANNEWCDVMATAAAALQTDNLEHLRARHARRLKV